jgi:hypothetical protein
MHCAKYIIHFIYEILVSCRDPSCQNELVHFDIIISKVRGKGHTRWSTCLGAFVKLREAIFSFIIPFCPRETTRLHQDGFHEILYLKMFRKSVEIIPFWLDSDKNDGFNLWTPPSPLYTYDNVSLSTSLETDMFQSRVVERIEKHILCSRTALFCKKILQRLT